MRLVCAALERIFAALERAVTALVYPWCLLRQRSPAAVRVPILMYHQVGPALAGVTGGNDRVAPARFETQMQAIADAGYRVIRLATLVGAIKEGRIRELRRCVVLTFDDGYRGQLVFAYPVLRRRKLPATFFIVAGSLGSASLLPHLADQTPPSRFPAAPSPAWLPLSSDEVREMAAGGMSIGSHALTHRSLGCMGPSEKRSEVRRSREILEQDTGATVDLFAYPFGSPAYGDLDATTEEALGAAGYAGACTTVVGRAAEWSNRLALPRLPIDERDGPFRIRCKLAGAYDWVGPIKLLWQLTVPRLERVNASPGEQGTGPALTIHEHPGH
ncbi:MAG TPA: polysaccharide deacetylase family protein [Patescibacteria group bacterium]|nr:polysaccharide deacetylase family protein [Patescibacteria group bacterium]